MVLIEPATEAYSPPTINTVTTATMILYADTGLCWVRERLLSLSSGLR